MDDCFRETNVDSKFVRKGEAFRNCLKKFIDIKNFGVTTIHDYQAIAVLKVKEMVDKDAETGKLEPCLIVAPTGSGKSGMIAMLPYVLQSKKVLIITPSTIISNQLAEAFGDRNDKKNCFFSVAKICQDPIKLESFLENVNIITTPTDTQKTRGNLVIVNAQKFGGTARNTLSLEYRKEVLFESVKEFFSEFDTLIVDEAHHYQAVTWKNIVAQFKSTAVEGVGQDKKIIFLTATHITGETQEKEPVYVLGEKTKERIAYEITSVMCEGKSTRKVKFDERDIKDDYALDIIKLLREHGNNERRFKPQAMVLVSTIQEANEVTDSLNARYNILQQNGEQEPMEMDDGEAISYAVAISGGKAIKEGLDNFTAGKHRVAVTCKVGLEGYNTSVTTCVILRKITTGRIMFAQFVGRCLRLRRNLEGGADKTLATILTYKKFQQRKLFKELNKWAVRDLAEENEVNGVGGG